MAFQQTRLQKEDLVLICEEPQYRTSQEATPRAFNSIAMTTTTFTDASVTASHIGNYVTPADGDAKGQTRQIVSISGTTATVDTAWNSTTSVTSIRNWQPADVPVVATSAGSTTSIFDTSHASITNEPDNYWNAKGYHLVFKGGPNAGKASDITDFTSSSGGFAFGDALTSTVANELAFIRRSLRPEEWEVGITHNRVERPVASYASAGVAIPTVTEGSARLVMPVRGLSASAGDGTAAVRPRELSDMLTSIFTEDLDTGDTVSSMSGTTLNVSDGTRWSVGNLALVNTGEVGQIRSISSNALTMGTSHITAGNVENSSVVYAAANYKRKDTGYRTMCVDYYMGGLHRKVLHGCSPTVALSATRDGLVTLTFEYSSGEAHEYTLTRPVTKAATNPIDILDTTIPRDGKAARCLLGGVNVLMSNLQLDFGFRPVMRPSLTGHNGSDGMTMTLEPISGSFSILLDENDRTSFEDIRDRALRGATMDFLYQNGTAPTEVFAFCIPAMQLLDAPSSFADGQGMIEVPFTVVLPQDVPGNSFNAALPPFSMGWL